MTALIIADTRPDSITIALQFTVVMEHMILASEVISWSLNLLRSTPSLGMFLLTCQTHSFLLTCFQMWDLRDLWYSCKTTFNLIDHSNDCWLYRMALSKTVTWPITTAAAVPAAGKQYHGHRPETDNFRGEISHVQAQFEKAGAENG